MGVVFGVGRQRAFDRPLDDSPDTCSSDKPRILFDVAESQILSYCHVADVRLFRPGQNSQQFGFPGAVGADQPNSVSLRNCKRDILEKWLRSKCFRDIVDVNDRRQRLRSPAFRGYQETRAGATESSDKPIAASYRSAGRITTAKRPNLKTTAQGDFTFRSTS